MHHIDFWHGFASTCSWLAAIRIEEEALSGGVTARWRPFLLGPAYAPTSPAR